MKRRVNRWILTTIVVLASLSGSIANAKTIAITGLENPQLVGEARLKVMLWNVFDAALYSETGTYDPENAFALDLTYLRTLSASRIVTKTIEEMRRLDPQVTSEQAGLWETQLLQIIPDVRKGTNITGVKGSDGFTYFYSAGKSLGNVRDENFTQTFFDIWLGDRTAEPKLRKKLLGA